MVQEMNDLLISSDEDLRYGPGIVSKLKNKYLSLALRESSRVSHTLRKANSLEHLLDNDNSTNGPQQGPGSDLRLASCDATGDDRKRAQSMDALDYLSRDELDDAHHNHQNQRNIDLIITNLKKNLHENYAIQRKVYCRHRIFLSDNERPPQDVVKKTKRIFENAANRRPHSQVGDVALKIATFKSIIEHEKSLPKKILVKKSSPTLYDVPLAKNVLEVVNDCSHVNKVLPFKKELESSNGECMPPAPVKFKQISREQLNSLKKCGTSVPIVINNSNSKSHLPTSAFYKYYRNKEITTFSAASTTLANVKQIGIIKPLVTNKSPVFQKETDVKIINDEQNYFKFEASNSIVFNFSGRKNIPDYIENDGMIFCSPKSEKLKSDDIRLKSKIKINDDLEHKEDDADEEDCSYLNRPPSPCNVSFTNDNVLIDGKSSISSKCMKRKKLRIKFDDSATKLFEYPSENSLLIEDNNNSNNNNNNNNDNNKLNLATYIPTKLNFCDTKFQLGVTRTTPTLASNQAVNDNINESKKFEEKMPWNSVTATDLLF